MSRVGSEIVLMLSMVVLARLVSPQDFGAFAVAVVVAGLAIGIPTNGVGVALVQRQVVTREHLQAGCALALLIAAVVGCVTLLISYVVIDPLIGAQTAALVRLSCPMFLLYAVGTVSTALLQRRLDFRRLAMMEICGNAARVVVSVGVALLFAGLGGTALVLGLLAGTAVTSAIAITGAPPPLPRLSRAPLRDISAFGLPAALAAIAWTGFVNGDYVVVAARLGTAAAGQYWRAYTLAVSYQSKVSVLMGTVAFPVLSRSATTEDLLALRARMVRVLTVVLFPLLAGLAITAPIVVPAVYGPAWGAAVVPTQILCLGGAATLVIDAIGAVLMATGRGRGLLGYGLGHFVVYVGSVVVASQFGLVAVASRRIACPFGLRGRGVLNDRAPDRTTCAERAMAGRRPSDRLVPGDGSGGGTRESRRRLHQPRRRRKFRRRVCRQRIRLPGDVADRLPGGMGGTLGPRPASRARWCPAQACALHPSGGRSDCRLSSRMAAGSARRRAKFAQSPAADERCLVEWIGSEQAYGGSSHLYGLAAACSSRASGSTVRSRPASRWSDLRLCSNRFFSREPGRSSLAETLSLAGRHRPRSIRATAISRHIFRDRWLSSRTAFRSTTTHSSRARARVSG